MSLADASETRKARLLALRKQKLGQGEDSESQDTEQPRISFRNYDPQTRTVKKGGVQDENDTIEKNVEGVAEKIIEEDNIRRAQDLDIHNIAPKRPNWDLKRALGEKLSKLQRNTQESIVTLIRQRLAAQKGDSDDLVGVMKAQGEPVSDDED